MKHETLFGAAPPQRENLPIVINFYRKSYSLDCTHAQFSASRAVTALTPTFRDIAAPEKLFVLEGKDDFSLAVFSYASADVMWSI